MSIIIMLLLLSLLIIVHELGHLIAALSFGIKVDKFGFGLPLGPTLYEGKVGNVTVLVHALLLGGYVAFAEDDKECDLPEDSPERFLNKPIWQRFVVVSAGVFANIVCAFFIVLFCAMYWHKLPTGEYSIRVSEIIAQKEASIWQSGLKEGDRVDSINNTKITNAHAFISTIRLSKSKDSMVNPETVQMNLDRLKKLNPPLAKDEIIPQGVVVRLPEFMPEKPIMLDKNVARGVKKYKDNQYKISSDIVKLRDSIGDVQNVSYYVSSGHYTLFEIAEAISDNVRPLNFVVDRQGKYLELKPIYPAKTGVIGIKFEQEEQFKNTKSFFSAIKCSAGYLCKNTYLMLVELKQIFTGEISLGELHGIIVITKVGGDMICHSGMFKGLLLTAIISMNLAIVNFLPIPALDGGHVLFLLIEKIMGRRVSDDVVEKIANISFMILIGLMVFVLFNDIYALITQKW